MLICGSIYPHWQGFELEALQAGEASDDWLNIAFTDSAEQVIATSSYCEDTPDELLFKTFEIPHIAVDEKHRNKGVGSELLKRTEAIATADVLGSYMLHLSALDEGLIPYYESHGFKAIDTDSKHMAKFVTNNNVTIHT